MNKAIKHIEIVGSRSGALSSMGHVSREAIREVLAKHYAHVVITTIGDLSDLADLALRKPDLVFLGMKRVPSVVGRGIDDPSMTWLSAYLDSKGIRYTGSAHNAIELELHKELAKQRLVELGLRTAKFRVVKRGSIPLPTLMALRYPLFVKPTDRGGGQGVDAGSLVYNREQLHKKVRSLAVNLGSDALVEEYLPGREFSVGVLKQTHGDGYSVMPIELVAPADKSGASFLSRQIKVADIETNLEVTDKRLKGEIEVLAIETFRALGARDYGRIDIRLDAAGRPHFLEANLLPSLLEGYGNFPKTCALNIGLTYESMIMQIVDLAFAHTLNTGNHTPEAVLEPI